MGENWNPFLRPQGYFRCIRCTCKLVSTSFILSSIPFLFSRWPIFMCISKNPDPMGLFLWDLWIIFLLSRSVNEAFHIFSGWKLSHIMQLYPYFWFAHIFFSMIGYCPHASNGHRNLRYLKTLLRLEILKKTPISHSPGFALNTPNLAYFTPKLFRWLRLRRESLRLQKFSVTNTVLSLPFSQQIQFTIRVSVVNLN